MARHGGPSLGCRECRISKRKCDEKRPTCGRCSAKSLKCSGPPDFFQTHLRDETSRYRKAKQVNSAILATRILAAPSGVDLSSSEQVSDTQKSSVPDPLEKTEVEPAVRELSSNISYPLQTAPEFRAESFLFHACESVSYTVPYPGWGPFVRILPKLYANAHRDSALHIATRALAFSITALLPGSSYYAILASRCYGAALQKTNAAIADPKASRSDHTLMATLLLSVFECYRPSIGTKTTNLYRSHLCGAISLVRHRGLNQFKNPVSKELFRTVRMQMVNIYARRKEHIIDYPAPMGWRSDPDDDHDALSLLTAAALDIPGLRADSDGLCSMTEPSIILQTVEQLLIRSANIETALLAWYDSFRGFWEPLVSYNKSIDIEAFPWRFPPAHNYPTLHIASTLNTYRTYRIYVHQVRLECFKALELIQAPSLRNGESQPGAMSKSIKILQHMCNDICASIPYHLDNKNVALCVGEGFISPPLIAASYVEELQSEQKDFIESILYQIAFSDYERIGPGLVWDARIMTRMTKFKNAPSALKSSLKLA